MKAVILAGGEGKRLRPLTDSLPKPMLPLLNRPCLAYGIEWLRMQGITDFAITVCHLSELIRNTFGDGREFGVYIRYFEEEIPLGTAGAIRNMEEDLSGTTLVVPGDVLVDFSLKEAIQFHQSQRSMITVLLKKVPDPIGHSLVVMKEDQSICRLLDGHLFPEVYSDSAVTGIYLVEPEVLQLIERRQAFDLFRDLLPLALANQLPVYGFFVQGYWRDLDEFSQLSQAQFDLLSGSVQIPLKGKEIRPHVWIEGEVEIHPDAMIEGPVWIGHGSVIEPEAKLLPYTILGSFTRISSGSKIERSILGDRTVIGESAHLTGCLVGDGAWIGQGAKIDDESVLAAQVQIGQKAWIQRGVKIWKEREVPDHATVTASLRFERSPGRSLFCDDRIEGRANIELTPSFLTRLASAYASVLPLSAIISIGSDSARFSQMIRKILSDSFLFAGVHVRDCEETVLPVLWHDVQTSGAVGSIYIKKKLGVRDGEYELCFYDARGEKIDRYLQGRIDSAYVQEKRLAPSDCSVGNYERIGSMALATYREELFAHLMISPYQKRSIPVHLICKNPMMYTVIQPLFEQIGCLFRYSSAFVEKECDSSEVSVRMSEDGRELRLLTTDREWILLNENEEFQQWIAHVLNRREQKEQFHDAIFLLFALIQFLHTQQKTLVEIDSHE